MKVRYIQDKEYDAEILWFFIKNDPNYIKSQLKNEIIPPGILEKINKPSDPHVAKNLVVQTVNEAHKKHHDEIELAIKDYQGAWDKINDIFSKLIEKITEHKWRFDEYLVALGPIHAGISNHGENIVARWIFEDPVHQLRITAHEILMIHIWDILDTKYPDYYKNPNEENKKQHLWALNEITTIAILGLEPELNKLWSDDQKGFDKFALNYPQLKNLKEKLKKIYIHKTDFSDYLEKSLAHLNNHYPDRSF